MGQYSGLNEYNVLIDFELGQFARVVSATDAQHAFNLGIIEMHLEFPDTNLGPVESISVKRERDHAHL